MIIKYWFLESRVHIKGPILCLLYSFVTVKNTVQSCGKNFFLDKNILILCHKFSNFFFSVCIIGLKSKVEFDKNPGRKLLKQFSLRKLEKRYK